MMGVISLEKLSDELSSLMPGAMDTDPLRLLTDEILVNLDFVEISGNADTTLFFREGNAPLLFSVAHGGSRQELPYQKRIDRMAGDGRARDLTILTAYFLEKYYSINPAVLINGVDRRYVDPNGRVGEDPPPFVDPAMAQFYKLYHTTVREWYETTKAGCCGLHLAFHSFSARNKVYPSSLNQFDNISAPGKRRDDPLRQLPLSVQRQIGATVVLGTHHRKTIDKERAIDLAFAQAFHQYSNDGFSGPLSVYVPQENEETLMSGRYETAFARHNNSDNGIDALQVEMSGTVLWKAFDRLLYTTIMTVNELAKKYNS
jgi:hypothetical protein